MSRNINKKLFRKSSRGIEYYRTFLCHSLKTTMVWQATSVVLAVYAKSYENNLYELLKVQAVINK